MSDENKIPPVWTYTASYSDDSGFSKSIPQPSVDSMNDMFRKMVEEIGELKYSNRQKLDTIADQSKVIHEQRTNIDELKRRIGELESRASNEFSLILQAHGYGHDPRCSRKYTTCKCDCGYEAIKSYLGDNLFK